MSKIKIDHCVVLCPTQEKWDKLLEWLEDNTDLDWKSGQPPAKKWKDAPKWSHYSAETFVGITDYLLFGRAKFYKENGEEILSFEQFMEKYDHIVAANKMVKPKRAWGITTEAKSIDGIEVSEDYICVVDSDGDLVWGGTENEAKDITNKLRKGLAKHKKIFNS